MYLPKYFKTIMLEEKEEIESFECIFPSKTDPHFSKAVMTSSNLFYGFSNRKKAAVRL